MSIKKLWQKNKEVFKFVFLAFFVWQVLIGGIIFLGEKYIPSSYQYIYVEDKKIFNPPWLWSRANFDGIHYLDIARKGYGIYQQAFFPLYPRLIRLLTPLFSGKDLVVGWGISWISLFLALALLAKLVKLDYEEKTVKKVVVFLLVFPTAFFFSMVYTESLFLFLILASFYFARTQKWWLAGIFGAFASATRLAGIFLLPALLVEWWEQRQVKERNYEITKEDKTSQFPALPTGKLNFSIVFIFLIPLGLFWYMRFLQVKFQNPFMFLHVQKIILLYQVFWRYFKMLWTVDKFSLTYFVVVLEFLTGLGFLGLLGLAYKKKIRLSYLVFAAFSYIIPTLTGTFSSMPRYVLTLFPCFIIIGLIENRIIRYSLFVISLLLLMACTILFSRGYWIA